jgi:septum formation protein
MGDRVLATVGGYELEGLGAQLMAKIDGDYFAILGLPLLSLLEFLRVTGAVAS